MNRILYFIFTGTLLIFSACGKDAPDTAGDGEAVTEQTPTENAVRQGDATVYPALSNMVRYGLTTCNKIDIIFHSYPISMSLSDSADVLAFQQFLGTGDVRLPVGCTSDATVLFQQDTLVAAEAELYIAPECQSFVFKALGKPAFGVPLTNQGYNYFLSMLDRVKAMQKEGGQ